MLSKFSFWNMHYVRLEFRLMRTFPLHMQLSTPPNGYSSLKLSILDCCNLTNLTETLYDKECNDNENNSYQS
jgi:hypothetical protein